MRTVFPLQYISDMELREQIGATTNKVEAYNGFSKWSFFGGEGIMAENDPEEQEKRIKYQDLVANIMIFQNVVDMTRVIRELHGEGYEISREDLAALSPYLTRHIKRFGDYFFRPGERSSTSGRRSFRADNVICYFHPAYFLFGSVYRLCPFLTGIRTADRHQPMVLSGPLNSCSEPKGCIRRENSVRGTPFTDRLPLMEAKSYR